MGRYNWLLYRDKGSDFYVSASTFSIGKIYETMNWSINSIELIDTDNNLISSDITFSKTGSSIVINLGT